MGKRKLSFARQRKLVEIRGRIGAGKNVLARELLFEQRRLNCLRRFVIVDYQKQFAAWGRQGDRLVHAPGSLPYSETVIYNNLREWSQVRPLLRRRQFHVIQSDEITLDKHIIPLCAEQGGLNLVVDELDDHMSKHKMSPQMFALVHRGAHFGVQPRDWIPERESLGEHGTSCSLIGIYRRDNRVHSDFLHGVSTSFFLYSDSWPENEAIAKALGIDAKEFHRLRSGLIPPVSEDFNKAGRMTRQTYFLRYDDNRRITTKPLELHDLIDPG